MSGAALPSAAALAALGPKQRRARRIEGMLRGVPMLGPESLHIDLTGRCNTRCRSCWHHSPLLQAERRPAPRDLAREPPLERVLGLLADAAALGTEAVLLSGMGEPFLYPHIVPVIRAALDAGLRVTVMTNLITLPAAALPLGDPRLEFLVSVQGWDEASWRAFHGDVPRGGYAQLVENLGALRAAGNAPKMVQVVDRESYRGLPAMLDFAARHGAKRVSFKLASLGGGTEPLALSAAQQAELQRAVLPQALALAQQLPLDTDLAAFATQVQPDALSCAPMEAVGCFMGYLYGRVTPVGDLLFCCNTQLVVGRIGPEAPLRALWRGPQHQALRDALRAGRFFPGCERCGKYKQNLKWSQRLRERLGEDRFAELFGVLAPLPGPCAEEG